MKITRAAFFGKLIDRVILAAKAEVAHLSGPEPYPGDFEANRAEEDRVTDRTNQAAHKLGEFLERILGDQFPDPDNGEWNDPSQVRVVVNGTHGCLIIPGCYADITIHYNGTALILFNADQVVQLAK